MKKITEQNVRAAFAGQSQAHMRYLIFSNKAKQEGLPNIARLFQAVAYAEQVHATNHMKALGDLGTTSPNLQMAIDGETFEVEEMYPAYTQVAKLQGEKGAVQSCSWALEAEKVHAGLYQKAKQAVDSGSDIELGDVHICSVCGWTVEGEAPDRCPLCGAPRAKFCRY